MNKIQRIALVFLFSVILQSIVVYGEESNLPGRRQALNAIMGERILQDNIHAVRNFASEMSAEARLAFLSDWVLPNPERSTLRMSIDFSQTHPRPQADEAGLSGQQIQTGAELISPAIDLLTVARQLNALSVLREKVESWQPETPRDELSKVAFLAALAISEERFEDASGSLQTLIELVKKETVIDAERGAEAIATWSAITHPETQEAAGDLLFVLYEQARGRRGPRSERWHRQIYSMKQALEAKFKTAENLKFVSKNLTLKNWLPVSRTTSATRGLGYPLAGWETRPGRARHVTSHDNDYLYYVSPLSGNFEVEADLTTFSYKDIHLGYGNLWAGPGYDLKACLVGEFRDDFPSIKIDPALTQPGDEMRVRLVVKDGVRKTSINGRVVYEKEQAADGDPWLSIHSHWYANGAVRNLSIAGNPTIPDELELAVKSELPGWLPYFDESVGHASADWRLETTPESPETRVLRGLRSKVDGAVCESLLRYHRPMFEDGIVEYDFYYDGTEEHSFAVHPALDRLVFVLTPAGVRTHWVTDGRFDATGLDPENLVDEPENRRGPNVLPFKNAAWNRLRLKLVGDRVDLSLNGQTICSRMIKPTNQRTFGLFHFADHTEAQIRNLRWRGSWPQHLPAIADQELVEDPVHQLIAKGAELPLVLDQDFEDGLPKDLFKAYDGKFGSDIVEKSDGVHVTRPGGNGFNKFAFGPNIVLNGDFEVTAALDDFQATVASGGNCNCHLVVEIADNWKSSCRLYRKNQSLKDQAVWCSIFKTVDGQRKYLFPDRSSEESTSGKLRLLRLGNQMHYMYAAGDSDSFRIIGTQEVGTDPTVAGQIQLAVETEKNGTTSAVWKRLTIRGQQFVPESAVPSTVAELNQQRDLMPAKLDHDFTKDQASEIDFRRIGQTVFTEPQAEGLKILASGSDNWTASGLLLRSSQPANFDVYMDIQIERMDIPAANQETSLILQTEFDAPQKPAVELKYYCDPDGSRDVRVQSRQFDNSGRSEWNVHAKADVTALASLRTARRGESVYFLYREKIDLDWKLLTGVHIGPGAVAPDGVRLMLHTGGLDRESQIWLQRIRVTADEASANIK